MRKDMKLNQNSRSGLVLSGFVDLQIINATTGQLIEHYKGNNLVVNQGRTNLAKLVGGDVAGLPITKIGFGEGTATPTPTDTSLTNLFIKNIDAASYPTPNQVMLTFNLGASEGNGLNITELGLFNSGNVLIARKTREAIIKTNEIIVSGLWILNIS